MPGNSSTGRFYWFDIDAIPGGNAYLSIGPYLPTMNTVSDFGFSYSYDGVTWQDIQRGSVSASTGRMNIDAISTTVVYGGGVGNSGAYKWGSGRPLSSLRTTPPAALLVYPDPSADGLFQVQTPVNQLTDVELTVFDALGRAVATRTLRPTGTASQTSHLDLSQLRPGIYTLQMPALRV
ncbi:MAG: T9SS type A sorting domain-containing protein [Hymenobacter sp.]